MAPSSETVQLALRARYTKQQGKCLSLKLIVNPMLERHASRGESIDDLEWFPTSKEPVGSPSRRRPFARSAKNFTILKANKLKKTVKIRCNVDDFNL